MGIFSNNAPRLWAAGLPVIPLMPPDAVDRDGEALHGRGKRPAISAWQEYASRMPSEAEKATFLARYSSGNIGLALGQQSGIVIVDIDSDDPRVLEVVERVAGPSPWVRIGRKGAALAYRFRGEGIFRLDHKVGDDVERIVELLSKGSQVVLPPSIHPDTDRPYAANVDLVDVLDKLQPLPMDFEIRLRSELNLAGFELTSRQSGGGVKLSSPLQKGQRDVGLTQKVGFLSGVVLRGEYTLQRAIDDLLVVLKDLVDNDDGEVAPEKHIENLVKFLRQDLERTGKALPAGWDDDLGDDYADLARDLHQFKAVSTAEVDTQLREIIKESGRVSDEYQFDLARKMAVGDMSESEIGLIIRQLGKSGVNEGEFKRHFLRPALQDVKKTRKAAKVENGEVRGELDAANLFIREAEDKDGLAYAQGAMRRWTGQYWKEVQQDTLMTELSDRFLDQFQSLNNYVAIRKMLAFRSSRISPNEVELGVNFQNGFLNSWGELLPHDKDLAQTYVLDFKYRPEAATKAYLWEKFLHDTWGDDADYREKVEALRFMMCASITGRGPKFQTAVLLKGRAGSGKSTILSLLERIMPEDTCSALDPRTWDKSANLSQLEGKLVNIVPDLRAETNIPDDIFKTMVDGFRLHIDPKFRDSYYIFPRATLWIASNHKVQSRDTSGGFTRRWLIFQFNKPVPKKDMDRDLIKKLSEEREAIFAWVMEALPQVTTSQNIPHPPSSLRENEQLKTSNNPVYAFLKSHAVITGEGGSTLIGVIYQRYKSWMITKRGAKDILSEDKFCEVMGELSEDFGFQVQDYAYVGLKVPPGLALVG